MFQRRQSPKPSYWWCLSVLATAAFLSFIAAGPRAGQLPDVKLFYDSEPVVLKSAAAGQRTTTAADSTTAQPNKPMADDQAEDRAFGTRMQRFLDSARLAVSNKDPNDSSVVIGNDRADELLSASDHQWTTPFLRRQLAQRFDSGTACASTGALQELSDRLTQGRWVLRPNITNAMCDVRDWSRRVFFQSAHAPLAALDNVESAALLRICLAGVHVYMIGDSWGREGLTSLARGLADEINHPKEAMRDVLQREMRQCREYIDQLSAKLHTEANWKFPRHYSAPKSVCYWQSEASGQGWPDTCGWPGNYTALLHRNSSDETRLTYQSKCYLMTPVIDRALVIEYVARYKPDFVILDLGRWGETAPKWVSRATNGRVAYMIANDQLAWFVGELRQDERTRALMFDGDPPRTRLILIDGYARTTHCLNGSRLNASTGICNYTAERAIAAYDVRKVVSSPTLSVPAATVTFAPTITRPGFPREAWDPQGRYLNLSVDVPLGHGFTGPVYHQRYFHQLGWLLCQMRRCQNPV